MKILILFVALFLIATASFCFLRFFLFSPKKASDVYFPIGSGSGKISLLDLSNINVKEFETLTGSSI